MSKGMTDSTKGLRLRTRNRPAAKKRSSLCTWALLTSCNPRRRWCFFCDMDEGTRGSGRNRYTGQARSGTHAVTIRRTDSVSQQHYARRRKNEKKEKNRGKVGHKKMDDNDASASAIKRAPHVTTPTSGGKTVAGGARWKTACFMDRGVTAQRKGESQRGGHCGRTRTKNTQRSSISG